MEDEILPSRFAVPPLTTMRPPVSVSHTDGYSTTSIVIIVATIIVLLIIIIIVLYTIFKKNNDESVKPVSQPTSNRPILKTPKIHTQQIQVPLPQVQVQQQVQQQPQVQQSQVQHLPEEAQPAITELEEHDDDNTTQSAEALAALLI